MVQFDKDCVTVHVNFFWDLDFSSESMCGPPWSTGQARGSPGTSDRLLLDHEDAQARPRRMTDRERNESFSDNHGSNHAFIA
jgi:hypothetical protein